MFFVHRSIVKLHLCQHLAPLEGIADHVRDRRRAETAIILIIGICTNAWLALYTEVSCENTYTILILRIVLTILLGKILNICASPYWNGNEFSFRKTSKASWYISLWPLNAAIRAHPLSYLFLGRQSSKIIRLTSTGNFSNVHLSNASSDSCSSLSLISFILRILHL